MATGDPEDECFPAMARAGTNPNNYSLKGYMDDITLIVAPMEAGKCYTELRGALTKAGVKLNEDKCTAWTTDGNPTTPTARTLWENARGHRGLVVCGFPANL